MHNLPLYKLTLQITNYTLYFVIIQQLEIILRSTSVELLKGQIVHIYFLFIIVHIYFVHIYFLFMFCFRISLIVSEFLSEFILFSSGSNVQPFK